MKDRKKSSGSAGWYGPWWHYENEPETRAAPDLISFEHFSRNEPGVFPPLHDALLSGMANFTCTWRIRHLISAHERLEALYTGPKQWARKAFLNVASSGKFSSDRTIAEYAKDIWRLEPCPVS
jgi:starch phosphorylase